MHSPYGNYYYARILAMESKTLNSKICTESICITSMEVWSSLFDSAAHNRGVLLNGLGFPLQLDWDIVPHRCGVHLVLHTSSLNLE